MGKRRKEVAEAEDDEDTWWYICLLCHQAFASAGENTLRNHRKDRHNNSGSAKVLILSQHADLQPKVKLTRLALPGPAVPVPRKRPFRAVCGSAKNVADIQEKMRAATSSLSLRVRKEIPAPCLQEPSRTPTAREISPRRTRKTKKATVDPTRSLIYTDNSPSPSRTLSHSLTGPFRTPPKRDSRPRTQRSENMDEAEERMRAQLADLITTNPSTKKVQIGLRPRTPGHVHAPTPPNILNLGPPPPMNPVMRVKEEPDFLSLFNQEDVASIEYQDFQDESNGGGNYDGECGDLDNQEAGGDEDLFEAEEFMVDIKEEPQSPEQNPQEGQSDVEADDMQINGQEFDKAKEMEEPELTKKTKKRSVFECKTCKEKFDGMRQLWVHKRQAHPGHERPQGYRRGTKLGKGVWVHKCKTCAQEFPTGRKLWAHGKAVHPKQRKQAPKTKAPKSPSRVSRGTRAARRPMSCTCKVCNKTYDTYAGYSYHIQTAHVTSRDELCSLCGADFKCKSDLRSHMRTHRGRPTPTQKVHLCSVCGAAFASTSQRARHETTHVAIGTLPCPHCPHVAKTRDNLTRHMRLHTDEKPFKCEVAGCGDGFKTKRALKRHAIKQHTLSGQAPLPCDKCDRAFQLENDLNYHVKERHVEYSCEVCGNTFEGRALLKRHTQSEHDGYGKKKRAYECTVCGKTFVWALRLKEHEATHVSARVEVHIAIAEVVQAGSTES